MPTKEEFTFLSKNGKTQIHAVRWLPDTAEYRAVLQITHGMIEYIDRYDAFASYLASLGFLVVGHDHLGHGASVETEKDWGYFSKKDGICHAFDLCEECVKKLEEGFCIPADVWEKTTIL